MSRKRLTAVIAVAASVLLIGSWLSWEPAQTKAQGIGGNAAFECRLGGVWRGLLSVEGGPPTSLTTHVMTPSDPTGRRFNWTLHSIEDITFGGLVPDAFVRTNGIGQIEKIGPDLYQGAAQYVAADVTGEVVYVETVNVEIRQTGCNTIVARATADAVAPDGTVLFCVRFTTITDRINFPPSCTDLPDFPS